MTGGGAGVMAEPKPAVEAGRLSADSSAALTALSGCGVFLVAWVHGTTLSVGLPETAAGGAVRRFEAFVAFGPARVAVPFYFVASGLLFFLGLRRAADLRAKLGRRASSLLLPYLAWSGLVLAAYAAAAGVPATAGAAAKLDGPPLSADVLAWLAAWVWDPVAGHLWFVRDLLVLNLLGPAFWGAYRLLGTAGWLLPAGCAAVWAALPDPPVIGFRPWWQVVTWGGLAGFTLGGWLAGDPGRLDRFRPRGVTLAAVAAAWFILCAVRTGTAWSPAADRLLDRAAIAAGLAAYWGFGPLAVAAARRGPPAAVGRHAFFCYAAHFPAVPALVIAVVAVGGGSPAAHLAAFLVVPPAAVLAAAGVAGALRKFAPPVLSVLSGGRGVARRPAPAPA